MFNEFAKTIYTKSLILDRENLLSSINLLVSYLT